MIEQMIEKWNATWIARYLEKIDFSKPDECWEWQGSKNEEGYGFFWLDGRNQGPHRIAWIFEWGEIPEGMYICHHCDNPSCCNPKHLFLGDASINMLDAVAKRRYGGEICARSVLTEDHVREIRNLYQSGRWTQGDLAQVFPVTQQTISKIINRKLWRGV